MKFGVAIKTNHQFKLVTNFQIILVRLFTKDELETCKFYIGPGGL